MLIVLGLAEVGDNNCMQVNGSSAHYCGYKHGLWQSCYDCMYSGVLVYYITNDGNSQFSVHSSGLRVPFCGDFLATKMTSTIIIILAKNTTSIGMTM